MNNCNCNQGLVPVNEPFFCQRMQAYVVRGPRGATGAQGPQGPQGLNGIITNNITLTTPQEVGVVSQGALPLAEIVTQNGTLEFNAGESAINLASGTYLIIYSLSVQNTTEGNATYNFAIGQDSIVLDALSSQVTIPANSSVSVSGNAVLNVVNNSSISIINNTDASVEVSNLIISIIKLA